MIRTNGLVSECVAWQYCVLPDGPRPCGLSPVPAFWLFFGPDAVWIDLDPLFLGDEEPPPVERVCALDFAGAGEGLSAFFGVLLFGFGPCAFESLGGGLD